jgi:hypothetical protein
MDVCSCPYIWYCRQFNTTRTHNHASSTILMSFWANVFLGKCLSGQMSFWAIKCLSGQMSFRAKYSGQNLPAKKKIANFRVKDETCGRRRRIRRRRRWRRRMVSTRPGADYVAPGKNNFLLIDLSATKSKLKMNARWQHLANAFSVLAGFGNTNIGARERTALSARALDVSVDLGSRLGEPVRLEVQEDGRDWFRIRILLRRCLLERRRSSEERISILSAVQHWNPICYHVFVTIQTAGLFPALLLERREMDPTQVLTFSLFMPRRLIMGRPWVVCWGLFGSPKEKIRN